MNSEELKVKNESRYSQFMKVFITLLNFIILGLSMLLGIFASSGVCVALYGPNILKTALGDNPDRSHPAFWLFLILIIPSMLLGACGALFGIMIPLFIKYQIPLAKKGAMLSEKDLSFILALKKYSKSFNDYMDKHSEFNSSTTKTDI